MTMMSATSALVPTKNNALGLGFTGNLGNIDAYISAVNRLPMLSAKHEPTKSIRSQGSIFQGDGSMMTGVLNSMLLV